MGMAYSYRCFACGFRIIDTVVPGGKRWSGPHTYDGSMQTILDGELGENFKRYIERHPDIKAEDIVNKNVFTYCGQCGELTKTDTWAVGKTRRVYANFPRKCEKCGGIVRVISRRKAGELSGDWKLCPKCKSPLDVGRIFMD